MLFLVLDQQIRKVPLVVLKNKRGRTIGYKDAPKDESVVSADSTTITSASGFSVGEVVHLRAIMEII